MPDCWLAPDRLFDGTACREGMAIRIDEGRVTEIAPRPRAPAGSRRVNGIVAPGFVDLQVNGGGGLMVNTSPTADAMYRIAAAHRRFGTVGILPTVISDTPAVLAAAVEAALAAKGRAGILGLHIEGPHLSVARRGTHAAGHLRPMDDVTIAHVRRLRDAGIPVMITAAPEAATVEQVAALAETGAVVSIGHTDASADQARELLAAGARAATHLFNAMSPMENRAPGVVGAIINSDAYAGVIADGIHVADEMIGLAIRARPVPDRMFLVSDAMPTVGGPDHFDLYGKDLRLKKGRLVNDEGSLAGAHLTQADGLKRLVHNVGVDLDTAFRMVTSTPARLMGLGHLGKLDGRHVGDLVCLDDDLSFVGYLSDV